MSRPLTGRALTGPVGAGRAARRPLAAAVAAAAAVAVLAGCATAGGGGTTSGTTGPTQVTARTVPEAGTAPGAATAASCDPYASLTPQPGGPSVTAGSWAATIRQHGFLVAGVDQTDYHWGYLDPFNGKFEGFDIDMIRDVAAAIFGMSPNDAALDARIHFKAISDKVRFTDVENGTVDIVAYTATVNCARMKNTDFSSIYYDAKQQVLVDKPATGTAPDLAQLGEKHAKVCATIGSDSVAQIQAAHADPVTVPYITDCLVRLEEGEVAGISTDNSILFALQAQDPDTLVVGPSLEDEPYGLVISKAHPDFVRFVNAVLKADGVDKPTGLWADSFRHWVSATQPIPTWPISYAG